MGRSYYETVDPEFGKKVIYVSLSIPLLIIVVPTYHLHRFVRIHGTAGIPRHRPAHRAHAIQRVSSHGGHECRENATQRNPAELLSGNNRKGDA